jgi:heptosyltransferase-2
VLVFADPDGYGGRLPMKSDNEVAQVPLHELKALMACFDLVVCNDSGPMHIANAVGTPVVAIFTSASPEWFAPRGKANRVVVQDGFPCRPCFDRCIFAEPYCNSTISVGQVLTAVDELLSTLAGIS